MKQPIKVRKRRVIKMKRNEVVKKEQQFEQMLTKGQEAAALIAPYQMTKDFKPEVVDTDIDLFMNYAESSVAQMSVSVKDKYNNPTLDSFVDLYSHRFGDLLYQVFYQTICSIMDPTIFKFVPTDELDRYSSELLNRIDDFITQVYTKKFRYLLFRIVENRDNLDGYIAIDMNNYVRNIVYEVFRITQSYTGSIFMRYHKSLTDFNQFQYAINPCYIMLHDGIINAFQIITEEAMKICDKIGMDGHIDDNEFYYSMYHQ